MKLLIEHCDVIDPQAPRSTKTDQSILVDGKRIAAIGEPAEISRLARAQDSGEELQTIDGRRFLAIPGLISAHTHSPENFMRGATERMPLEPWLVWLYSTCGLYTPRDHYLAAAMSAIEMLLSGCTASFDHVWHAGQWSNEVLDSVMQAYRDSGIRATVAPMYDDHDVVLDVGDALGFDLRQSAYGMAHGGD
ncbi:MAG: amidohydrolase family protein [Chloroflexi bacterium]|nr:amidohydrolase family protein [Chloroflexota bacterium]